MTWFLESFWAWLICGACLEVVCLVCWKTFALESGGLTSRAGKGIAAGMLGILLLALGGIVLERLVVTPREEILETLDLACRAFESNDSAQVKRYIASSQRDILPRVDLYMGMVRFTEVRLRQIQVHVNSYTSPMTAKVECFGVAWFEGQGTTAMLPYKQYAANFRLGLVREADGWKVENIEGDPQKPLGHE